ncbi:MAG: hypothetical protein Q9182_006057 [Xanthomendoza sp. 2 TL-2023]
MLGANHGFDQLTVPSAIAAVGAGFWKLTPNHRPFTLVDPSISFPYVEHEKISTAVLAVLSLLFPAISIFLVAIIFLPGPSVPAKTPKSVIWRRKLWEWNTGWLGLGLTLALTFLLTMGMKNLFGKPRPDLLSRCKPDYEHQADYAIGGYPQVLNGLYLVSATICRQTDMERLNNGFTSFPSGSPSHTFSNVDQTARPSSSSPTLPSPASTDPQTPDRSQSAAPPTYLHVLLLIPICLAIYISSTRYSDFRHHGFDILFGSLMGISISWFGFRMYHLPIRRGGGCAWGPRSEARAFATGIGLGGYREGQRKRDDEHHDLESGKDASQEMSREFVNGGYGMMEPSNPAQQQPAQV